MNFKFSCQGKWKPCLKVFVNYRSLNTSTHGTFHLVTGNFKSAKEFSNLIGSILNLTITLANFLSELQR